MAERTPLIPVRQRLAYRVGMIEIREVGPEDLERWIAMAGSVRPDRAGSAAEYLDWRRQAEDMAWFVASRDGEDVGVGFAYVGWHSAPGTGNGEAFVLPAHRSTGVGSALYRELASWVLERGCVTLETTVAEDDADSLRWVDRRGFREVGRSSRLVLDLTAIDAPAVAPPAGVEIVSWAERPELGPELYEVACDALPYIPGREATQTDPYETWLARDMLGANDSAEATFIAIADGEVAGYAKLSLPSEPGATVARHDITGVKREFRRRGIASALKRAEIAWAKRAGYETLETENEARNEPIRLLNEKHGYAVRPGLVVLRDSLAGIE